MSQIEPLTIGQSIRNARKKAKIKQGELAKIIGHGRNAISKWETDKRTPLITAVIDIADALGVSIDELVGRDAIKTLPTDDVVEFVRCKDCIYHNVPPCPMRLSLNWTNDNDFCSYGKRKEGAEE